MKNLFTIFISLFLFSTIAAQELSIVADNVQNGGSMYYFHARKVARTPDGLLMVVWVNIGGTGGQIAYSIYDSDFQVWSPEATISAAGDRADKPGIAADELGNIHACWQERGASSEKYVIMYSKYDGVAWSTPVKVSLQDANNCEEASIEVDSDNNIWIVYNNDGAGAPDEFVHAVISADGGQTWSAESAHLSESGLIDGSITNARCALAAGPDGKMVAIWHNGQPWDSSRREISINQYDGVNWLGEVMISDTTTADRGANWYPTVAVDSDANIYAIYHTNDISTDTTRTRQVILQKKAWDQTWDESVSTTIFTETAADMLSISAVADENDVIHLVYRGDMPVDETGMDVIYYTFSKDGGAYWEPPIIISRGDHDAGYATIGNRVRPDYGMDIAFREGSEAMAGDPDVTAIVYVNIPYDYLTDIVELDVPVDYELLVNYPNPFNPSTTFEFSVLKAGNVQLVIYDVLGNEVATLINQEMNSGHFSAAWNGKNNYNRSVASGVYIASLKTQSGIQSRKIALLK